MHCSFSLFVDPNLQNTRRFCRTTALWFGSVQRLTSSVTDSESNHSLTTTRPDQNLLYIMVLSSFQVLSGSVPCWGVFFSRLLFCITLFTAAEFEIVMKHAGTVTGTGGFYTETISFKKGVNGFKQRLELTWTGLHRMPWPAVWRTSLFLRCFFLRGMRRGDRCYSQGQYSINKYLITVNILHFLKLMFRECEDWVWKA